MGKKLKDFLAENPDITVLGLAWSLFWRMQLLLIAVSIGVALVSIFMVVFLVGLR